MPIITCRNCGHKTNTGISDHVNSTDDKADGCYGRFVNGIPEKGCAYDNAPEFNKCYVRSLIQGNQEMKIIKEAKRLLTTGRISSDGIKYGLYNPKNQTL